MLNNFEKGVEGGCLDKSKTEKGLENTSLERIFVLKSNEIWILGISDAFKECFWQIQAMHTNLT